ncbi:MAG: mechanosensitive ion channel [Caldilineaceae bacterium]
MVRILTILETALIVSLLLAVTVFLAIRLRQATQRLFLKRAPTWAGFLSNVVQLLVLLAGLSLIVYVAGLNTAVILTVVAIFTAGISLALDGSVRDLIATTKLLTFGYYKVGDIVTLTGHTGKVAEITAFSTILETGIRDKVIIGNKEIVDTIILNHTAVPGRTIQVMIPIRGAHNRAFVMESLQEIAQHYPDRLPGPEFAPNVFYELQPDHEKYTISLVIPNQVIPNRAITTLALAAAARLQENGIQVSPERVFHP